MTSSEVMLALSEMIHEVQVKLESLVRPVGREVIVWRFEPSYVADAIGKFDEPCNEEVVMDMIDIRVSLGQMINIGYPDLGFRDLIEYPNMFTFHYMGGDPDRLCSIYEDGKVLKTDDLVANIYRCLRKVD